MGSSNTEEPIQVLIPGDLCGCLLTCDPSLGEGRAYSHPLNWEQHANDTSRRGSARVETRYRIPEGIQDLSAAVYSQAAFGICTARRQGTRVEGRSADLEEVDGTSVNRVRAVDRIRVPDVDCICEGGGIKAEGGC